MQQSRRPSSWESLHFDPSKCARQPRSNLPRRPSRREGMDFSLARCRIASVEPSISNTAELEYFEAESVGRNGDVDSIKGCFEPSRRNCARSLFSAQPVPSEINGSEDAWLAPGNVVWAKIDSNTWWPAQIMDREGALQLSINQSNDSLVPVQFYGKCEYAWVDRDRGLSHFNHCYEERSSNPLNTLQDALRQALQSREGTKSSEHSEKFDVSSQTTGDRTDVGRGKRKPKPKVHFDEMTRPEKSTRKVRRMRIMRLLGLMAPVGSPFILPRARRAC